MKRTNRGQAKGLYAAMSSALFLGLAPVFGKLAIVNGLPWTAVVVTRTLLAAFLLFVVILVFQRSFLYIYPAGLLGCILAGWINGIGSLLYYSALGRIDASLGQMIYSLYPLFVAVWLWLDKQPPSRLTFLRLGLVLPALVLLVNPGGSGVDLLGVFMMLGAAILYALHLPINQRVLYDMPAPTVTLYTLMAMGATVLPAFFFSNVGAAPTPSGWIGLVGLTLVTFFSRLTLFLGVKHLGGSQTALLGLGELLITILFSHLILHDRLAAPQWMGVALLILILAMMRYEKPLPRKISTGGLLSWLRPPGLPADLPWQPHD